MSTNLKIGITTGLVIGVTVLALRYSLKQKGFSHNKFLADTFNVKYTPKTEGLKGKFQDMEEQLENEATKDGITFRATGDNGKARNFSKLDPCIGMCVAPKRCYHGVCI